MNSVGCGHVDDPQTHSEVFIEHMGSWSTGGQVDCTLTPQRAGFFCLNPECLAEGLHLRGQALC